MTEFLTRSVRVYFQQLTVGCGQAHCDNPGCASCPDFVPIDPNEAASRSIKAAAGIEKISRCWPLVPAAQRVAYVPDLIMEIASHLGPADWSRFRAISSRFRDASCDLRVLVRVAKNCKGKSIRLKTCAYHLYAFLHRHYQILSVKPIGNPQQSNA